MKRILSGAAMAVALFAGAGQALAADVTLKMSNWFPPGYYGWTEILGPWVEQVERVTEGRVKIDVLPKVVGTVPGQFDVVRDGLADIGYIVPGYTPGRFDLIGFGELPLLAGDVQKLGPSFDAVYRKHLEPLGVFDGVHVLSIFAISPLQMHTKNKKVETPADVSGLKLRASSAVLTDAVKLMNGVPIVKSVSEAFELLSSGTIDGQITTPSAAYGFNMLDLHNQLLLVDGGFSNSVNMLAMNEKSWAKISPEDQAAITSVSQSALAALASKVSWEKDLEAFEAMRAAGYTITEATPEATAEFAKVLAPIEAAWLDKAKAAGLADPAAVLAEYRAMIAK